MDLKSQWHRLDPTTRRWFLDNPGCVVVPRTISTIVAKVADEPVVRDQHGTIQLTSADLSFIRTRVHGSSPDAAEHRFFDAVQPEDADRPEGTDQPGNTGQQEYGESGHLD